VPAHLPLKYSMIEWLSKKDHLASQFFGITVENLAGEKSNGVLKKAF